MANKELPPEPPASEITPEEVYLRRREFLKNAVLIAGTAAGVGSGLTQLMKLAPSSIETAETAIQAEPIASGMDRVASGPAEFQTAEAPNTFTDATTYNNYYEFGVDKSEPAKNAHTLQTRPWTVAIEGECNRPQVVAIDELLKWFPLEERIYRMRCVEAWSMVVPWVGFSLRDLLTRVEPTSSAKFVAFETLHDLEQMPLAGDVLPWPYVEGLRLDEALHPLTILAVGLYGKVLPSQNGAPLRLIVPWKYGFKGIKSIVRIRLTSEQPPTTWNLATPSEYGFYANVNPAVDHPRWSQATERRIGEFSRRATLPFNGYGEFVANMYAGMDLRQWY